VCSTFCIFALNISLIMLFNQSIDQLVIQSFILLRIITENNKIDVDNSIRTTTRPVDTGAHSCLRISYS